MGKVMSMVARKAQRFNVENRAHRVLERDKPVPAPKYDANVQDMQRTLELDPKFLEKLNKKDATLDDRLKSVYVTSEDRFIDYAAQRKQDPEKPLPLNRTTPEDFEYGFQEPKRAAAGRATLRDVIKFITDHQNEPELWTKSKIAAEYKMKEDLVGNILLYYKTFSVYIPDRGQKESILTQAKSKMLGAKSEKEST